MQAHYDEVRALGGEVLLVTQARPAVLAAHLHHAPLPFPAAADPTRQAYRAFGLERTTWQAMLRPGIILRYLKLVLRGWLPRLPHTKEDVLQLGGDFVLDADGRLAWARRSADPTDRPTVGQLLEAVRAAKNGVCGRGHRV